MIAYLVSAFLIISAFSRLPICAVQTGKSLSIPSAHKINGPQDKATFPISALFKKYTGQTPTAYIERKRLDKAKQLLAQGSDSVKQIAHAVGFFDEYYFMRRFKKDVDLTPSEYRERFSGCRYT